MSRSSRWFWSRAEAIWTLRPCFFCWWFVHFLWTPLTPPKKKRGPGRWLVGGWQSRPPINGRVRPTENPPESSWLKKMHFLGIDFSQFILWFTMRVSEPGFFSLEHKTLWLHLFYTSFFNYMSLRIPKLPLGSYLRPLKKKTTATMREPELEVETR